MLKQKYDAIIIGAGPAGIFTAIELLDKAPSSDILLIDKGSEIDSRVCPARKTGKCAGCKICAIISGWSGAGAFSDGKLSLSQEVGGRISDYLGEKRANELISYADGIYLRFGANETVHGLNNEIVDRIASDCQKNSISLVPCPVRHLGTERAFDVLRAMYLHLIAQPGFTFAPRHEATDILVRDGHVCGAHIVGEDGEYDIESPNIVAAPGRGGSAWLTDTAHRLGIKTTNNEVDIGVRVETPNSVMEHLTKHLYEAKLIYYADTFENKVRTFCMNPGGVVAEEHYDNNIAVVNGHSYADDSRKTENTNFALLVSTRFTEPFNQPIEYGKYIAQLGNMLTGGGIMVQRLGDLLKGRRTDYSRLARSTTRPTLTTAVPGDLSFVLPHRHLTCIMETLKALDSVAPGLYSKNTLLYGVEAKFYSSKTDVDENFETAVRGFYTIGDGAGITRGLMQASVTGVVVARSIAGYKE